METTKEEITDQIISILKDEKNKVNPSVITQKLKWSKDRINEICDIFGKSKFNEVLESIPFVKLEIDSNKTPSVWYEGDSVTPPPILLPLRKFCRTAKFNKSRLNPISA